MTDTAQTPSGRGVLALIVFLAVSALVAAIGGFVTAEAIPSWYAGLTKPAFNPPNSVFGPVWTLLYAMMSVAAWRIWMRRSLPGARTALALYWAQLVLNLGWSLIFFDLRAIGAALIEVLVLLLAIVGTGILFWRLDRPAGALFVPYGLWVLFASALNFALWRLN
jgi:tryptophan-rich sensory protein